MTSRTYDAAQGDGSAATGRRSVRLAHEAPFRIADMEVLPATRQVERSGKIEVLEPRVMQVLVVLARARGEVVSRDDLIEFCWDGRVVGDDAINRVVGRLRRLSDTLGQGVFRIDTVTKVGYRLMPCAPDMPEGAVSSFGSAQLPPEAPLTAAPAAEQNSWWPSRRTFVRGSLATVLAAAGPALWTLWERNRPKIAGHVPTPEAKRLYEEGMKAQYFGLSATTDQAEAYFRQAVAADPNWADAWGSLAMSYRHMLDGETNVSQWRLVEQTRSAARRALSLDPGNEEALVALALIRSPYRRWAETEAHYVPLVERFPDAFVLRGHLGRVLRDVGRFEDAVAHTQIAAKQQPFIPFVGIGLGINLWGAGRLHEAQAQMDRVHARWPKFVPAWFTRFEFLLHSGQADAAIAFASDREGRPSELPDFLFERRIVSARALASRNPADVDAAVAEQMRFIRRSLSQPPYLLNPDWIVAFFAAIGDLDTAFAVTESWFFDRGRFAPPVARSSGPLTRRESDFLFMPNNAALRSDRRFAPLLAEIGLEDYWRDTGMTPDFRRRSS